MVPYGEVAPLYGIVLADLLDLGVADAGSILATGPSHAACENKCSLLISSSLTLVRRHAPESADRFVSN